MIVSEICHFTTLAASLAINVVFLSVSLFLFFNNSNAGLLFIQFVDCDKQTGKAETGSFDL